ncbi:hypothetical protein NP233_g2347 [Leucocoprinus birnbaumii]|uniref:Fungal lipase-type domain-containing protein n=1 Tax=Leucocoprinus birnbaumii TaxID=56174 RepID=A0AAD5W4N2_9AGAR|nr:hypothetical protein NP233_g2347 [Leucocoprinus birnbaumii]
MDASGPVESISAELYQDLVHYFKFATSAYTLICPRPNGKKLVLPFTSISGDYSGYVARDDDRREIIVAFKGSASILAFLADAAIILVPFVASGITAPSGVRVHAGFLVAWTSIQLVVRMIVAQQIKAYPDYAIVTSGHSLGGVLALFCAIASKQHHPNTTYSYGAPRAEAQNTQFATFVNKTLGKNAYRVVHGNDGVPTIIPTWLGYHHHGVEHWQHTSPPSEGTTRACSIDGEDPQCSASIPTKGINPAHWAVSPGSLLADDGKADQGP